MDAGSGLIGRDAELAALEAFLRDPNAWPMSLVLEGEPGIGKTTLWLEGVRRAEARGFRVLRASPAAPDQQLSFVGLGDLLHGVLEGVLPRLPGPQRRAIGIALLLDEPGDDPPDRRAISVAFSNALRILADKGPLLIAVDDVQWLDASSRVAIEYAARRLRDQRVALLLAQRSGPESGLPLALDGAIRVTEVRIGPLSLGALHALLREELDLSLRRPALRRIHEISGGNPFYALELGRSVSGDELPPPRSLAVLVRDRVARLAADTLDVLVVAAALSDPRIPLLERASAGPRTWTLLQPAVAAGVVEVTGERVRFTHPLLAWGVYAQADPASRRALHARLAELTPGLEERARNRALATEAPDRNAAAMLEEAAGQSRARGAPEAAAELAAHARRLTPASDTDAARRRSLLAAECYWAAGDYDRGRAILEQLIALPSSGAPRAEALLRLATSPKNLEESRRLCERALEEAADDLPLRSRILRFLALLSYQLGELDRSLEHASAAVVSARLVDETLGAVAAEAIRDWLAGVSGEPFDLATLRRAAEIASASTHHGDAFFLGHMYVLALTYSDLLPEAIREAEVVLSRASDSGYYGRANLLVDLAQASYRAGEWQQAKRATDEAVELLSEYGVERIAADALLQKVLVDVSLGQLESARRDADRVQRGAADAGDVLRSIGHRLVLGFLELSLGDNEAAARELDAALTLRRRTGIRNPAVYPVPPLAVQAYVACGALDSAEVTTRELEKIADTLTSPRAIVYARRCRGLVLAARGDLDGARTALGEALTQHSRLPGPFERGLTLLALGQTERRAKRKRAARETLEAALGIFEQLPAPLWAAKARAELARIGGRVAHTELTATEREVAALVARGLSNREVAAALVVSERAVEANLTRIYEKLGIRSRTALARRVASEEVHRPAT